MIFKIPVPTNLDEVFGTDYLSQNLYVFFLIHSTISERAVNRNGRLTQLKRGQCYATISNLARRFSKNERTIKKSLKILSEIHNKIQYVIDEQGVVVTIQSFNEEIKMQNDLQNEIPNEYRTHTERIHTNKNDKNEENDMGRIPPPSISANRIQGNEKKRAGNTTTSYSKSSFAPCSSQELYEVAVSKRIPLEYVIQKQEQILITVESGEMKTRYPHMKSTYHTLSSWLEMDKKKGFVTELDGIGMMILESQSPEKIQERNQIAAEIAGMEADS